MTDITKRELIDEAAIRVGALGIGQTLNADELAYFERSYRYLAAQLAEDEVLQIGDDDAIPDSWAPYIATLLANLCGPAHGVAFDLNTKVATEAILCKLVRVKETYERQITEYF
jgi:hypothetical protein